MGSEIGLQGGAQYSYRPSFSPAGQMMTWGKKLTSQIGYSSPLRTGACGYAAVFLLMPLSFPVGADANCGVLTLFFLMLLLSSADGGYIVTETRMALALFAALWLPCCCHMSCSNTLPTTTPAPVSALLTPQTPPPHHHVLILSC